MDGKAGLIYAMSGSLSSYRENFGANFLSSLTVAFSLAIFAFFFIVFTNLNIVVESWGDRTHIVVYIKDSAINKNVSENVAKMKNSLLQVQGVKSVDYISKDKALSDLKKELKDYQDVIEGIGANPLPASFDIKLIDRYQTGEGLGVVVDRLSGFDWVGDIQFGEEWVEKFSSFLAFAKLGTFVIAMFLASATLFIISNTIRLTVFARRDEIEVMRLVGASDMFIKIPFFIEGLLQGLSGGIIALAMLYVGRFLVSLKTPEYFLFIIENSFSVIDLALALCVSGIVLGAVGSLMSLRKFIKV